MEIKIKGSVDEIGDQVAALDRLFQTEFEHPVATPLSAVSPAEPPASPAPPVAGIAGPGPGDVVELDPDGQPWNGEIHSSNHSRKKDGRWTMRRNVDKGRAAAIYAEWTARAATVEVAGPPPPPSVIPPSVSTGVAPPLPFTPPPPPPPALGGPPVPPPAPVAEDPLTACIRVAAAIFALTDEPGQKAVISARINAVMTQNGLPGGDITTLQANPQFAPLILVGLRALAAELGVQC